MKPHEQTNGASFPSRVLVIGGSYGGLAATLNLVDLCQGKAARFKPDDSVTSSSQVTIPVQITIVDERDGFYNLIGSPLALVSSEYASQAWTKFEDIPALQRPELRYLHGSVTRIDQANKLATVLERESRALIQEKYDFLVVSSGLRRAWPVVPQSLTLDEYLPEVTSHISSVRDANGSVVVIGGGAVGVEMASETKMTWPKLDVKLIHSRQKLLSSEDLPDDFKDHTLTVLEETGVKVITGCRVTDISTTEPDPNFKLSLSDGTKVAAGHVINARSTMVPSTTYLSPDCLDKDGYVKITPSLKFLEGTPNAESHFAVGDIAAWSGIRRCGGAMHMGHYAAINIHQQMLQQINQSIPEFVQLAHFKSVIGLAVGHKAITYDPENGVKSGEDIREIMFGNDYGKTICWNYLKLATKSTSVPVTVV